MRGSGFPNELIKFEQVGTKPDGSKKWRILNAWDGTEHKHKPKEAPKSKERLIAVMIGNEAKPILDAIKNEGYSTGRTLARTA